jgi:hypothetical protein
MLVGGIVEPGAGAPGALLAFVSVHFGPGGSRLFRVGGSPAEPEIREIPPATTIDLSRCRAELESELAPAVEAIEARGGRAAIAQPSADWVCTQVRAFLLRTEGVTLE